MCGIVGLFDQENACSRAIKALNRISYRGKDGCGICCDSCNEYAKDIGSLKCKSESKNAIAHCLHSVVGLVKQPLIGKGKFAANCEIYNWKELNEKHGFNAKNDAELLFNLIEKKGVSDDVLKELDGVYSFIYWIDGKVYAARDIIGLKPLWFAIDGFLVLASEKKALEDIGVSDAQELNPRQIIEYDVKSKKLNLIERRFFSIAPEHEDKDRIKNELKKLLSEAIKKRIPERKFGILFSGGIDSTFIAMVYKEIGFDFTCYTAGLEEEGLKEAEDLVYAEKVSKELGLKLKVRKIKLNEVEKYLKIIEPLIESSDVTKVGVALPFYLACEQAAKDGVKVIFSGLGSEEIFAGYERHGKSSDVNKECLSGLLKMYERDLYRDDVVTMFHNIELRVPFLDKKLVDFALKIPAKFKISDEHKKIILREIAEEMGLKKEFAWRKKRAAQYGSNFDKAIGKLAKKNKSNKAEYLNQFYKMGNQRIGVLFSSGKDSCYSAYIMKKRNYDVACLITMKSKNPDSYMFHTPNVDIARLQAEAMEIPIIFGETEGEKEKELDDLKELISKAKEKYKLDGIATGALFSDYQRQRIEKICDSLGLKMYAPLWHKDQELEMRELINNGFEIIFSSIAAEGLDRSWLGRKITLKDVDRLVQLNRKYGINIAGEGGEFESLVIDAPMFKKKIKIVDSEIKMEVENSGIYKIKKVILAEK